ncbi:MAG: FecR domain-containing protein [Deltaproteobacteria bacterium]|nr:FecR domain-containing protein [Deltaproteobacteria bacterium]
MNTHNDTERECERCWELADREKSGGSLAPDEFSALRHHLLSCPACAADAALATLVATLDETPTPGGEPATSVRSDLDDAARERWVAGILRRARRDDADCPDRVVAIGSGSAPEPPSAAGLPAPSEVEGPAPSMPKGRPATAAPRRAPRAIAAFTLLASVAAIAYIIVSGRPRGDRDEQPPSESTAAALFLVAGAVRVDAAPARAGDECRPGSVIRVATGRLGVGLCGARLFLDAATSLRLTRLDADRCEARLESGRVAADARGLRKGTRLVVSTDVGDVQVTGTVFAVEVDGADVEARVLEGSVQVSAVGRAAQALGASQAVRVGATDVRRLSAAEVERDRRLVEWLPAERGAPTALLDVSSDALSAEVVVDGMTLGPAPVTALVPLGRREITLRGPHAPAIRETVELRAGDRFERRYGSASGSASTATLPGITTGSRPVVAAPPRVASNGPPGASGPGESVPATVGIDPPAPTGRPGSMPPVRETGVPASRPAPPPTSVTAAPAVGPPAVAPTAPELLAEARRRREAGDWAGAAAAYEDLATRFPDSGEARATLVPLGQLRLERLDDATGALRAFDEYLAKSPAGALGEEALWGRIQALRRLARPVDEATALREFAAGHPASLRIGEARRRLAELEGARQP